MGVELLYNSVKTEVRIPVRVGDGDRHQAEGAIGPEKMLIRCSKESHHPAEWASG